MQHGSHAMADGVTARVPDAARGMEVMLVPATSGLSLYRAVNPTGLRRSGPHRRGYWSGPLGNPPGESRMDVLRRLRLSQHGSVTLERRASIGSVQDGRTES